jgi:hypothetical protein
MNRQHRAHIAQETLIILETGAYTLPDGDTVSLRTDLNRACAGTVCYQPEAYPALFQRVLAEPIFQDRFEHIAFAIYDTAPQPATFAAFQRLFDP